jgi:hypothetical protein
MKYLVSVDVDGTGYAFNGIVTIKDDCEDTGAVMAEIENKIFEAFGDCRNIKIIKEIENE